MFTAEQLKNILALLQRGAEAGVLKSTVDSYAFVDAHQAVSKALQALDVVPAPEAP